jgi:hypothetical protein
MYIAEGANHVTGTSKYSEQVRFKKEHVLPNSKTGTPANAIIRFFFGNVKTNSNLLHPRFESV